MRKIPTLFVRNPDDMKHVLLEVTPGCGWVMEGQGVATRKFDGTCVRRTPDGQWWARREVKPGKAEPNAFVAVETDPITGKTVGWEPAEQSSFWKFLQEATEGFPEDGEDATYELCGPKINGNPEGFESHVLIDHELDTHLPSDVPRSFDGLRDWLLAHDYEGIVWHHPDGRMAKLKKRDFT